MYSTFWRRQWKGIPIALLSGKKPVVATMCAPLRREASAISSGWRPISAGVEVDDGLDAVVLHAEFEDLADLVGDGIEVPDVAMIMLAARISVANVLVREGDAPRLLGRCRRERYGILRHY